MSKENTQPQAARSVNWAFLSLVVCGAFAFGYVCGQVNLSNQPSEKTPVVSLAAK